MAQLISLSDEDIAQLRSELAAGRPSMVWFTKAAVGVAAGASAKVVAFDEPAEGDFIQVRPAGSKDVLSFAPAELTRTRPPRRKAAPKTAKAAAPAPAKASGPRMPDPAPAKPPAAPSAAPAQPPEIRPTAAPTRPAPRRPGRSAPPAEVTVTLSSTPDGDWRVEVVVGKKRTVRSLPVPPADVARAARALPGPVADAVDRALDSARRQQQNRVAALQAELEQAQRALTELG
ncbi:MAG TPA: DUF6319 family protein [Actinophytocola sp.]|uniref:DUF6319 family protein n=1 Tax=Actinophytocola sp. TaxID=1872138 RepID=UPI002DBFEF0F|nr:DUF6319 family protein [Actinophytocola sp.]HEU5474430.1 DUF6319 family protein [Actinophytocola sp.]